MAKTRVVVGTHLKTHFSDRAPMIRAFVEWIDPGILATTPETTRKTPGVRSSRTHVNGTLMRHGGSGPAPTIRLLAPAVSRSSRDRRLVSSSGCAQLRAPASLTADIGTVSLPAITACADRENRTALRIATSTHAQGTSGLIRYDHGHGGRITTDT